MRENDDSAVHDDPDTLPTPSNQERFNECAMEFIAHDYPAVCDHALAMLHDGFITHGLVQMLLIAAQRSGQTDLVRGVAEQIPRITEELSWERTLLDVTLGNAHPDVFGRAADDEKRAQLLFYVAARLLTQGQVTLALDALRQSLQLCSDSFESALATGELSWIEQVDAATSSVSSEPERSIEDRITTLTSQAQALFHQGEYDAARSVLQHISELQRTANGEHHPNYAAALYDLAAVHSVVGDFVQAEAAYRRALAIQEMALGKDHPQTRSTRKELAAVLGARGQLHESSVLYNQVLTEEKAAGLHRNAEWAEMASNQARLSQAIDDTLAAEERFRDALDVSQEVSGPRAETTLEITGHLVDLLMAQRRLDEAEALCSELVEARRPAPYGQASSLADALDRLARIKFDQGDVERAEDLWKESLATLSKMPQGDGPRTARILNRLGASSRAKGSLERAAQYFDQALEAAREIEPHDASLINGTLGNQALVLHDLGRLDESESRYRQILDRLFETPDSAADDIARVQNNLAMVLIAKGGFTEAESLLIQARDSHLNRHGEQDLETVKGTANLGLLYYEMRLYDRAEPLLRTALIMRQEILPRGHPDLAESLQNLAELYRVTGRLDLAEHLLNQALDVWQGGAGKHPPGWATTVNNLALLCIARNNWARAEELMLEAIKYRRAILGEQHADLATCLDTLAELYRATGRYSEAEPICRQALAMRRAVLGEVHPDLAWSLNNLALIVAATGRIDEAFGLLQNSSAIDDRLIGQVLAVGSEAQRLQFLTNLRVRHDVLLSLVLQHRADRPEALRVALDLVLRRKGLAADVLATQAAAIRSQRDPTLIPMLEELAQLRRDIAARTLTGPEPGESMEVHQEILARAQEKRENIEAQLARNLPRLGWEQRLRQIDAVAVARALPVGGALVEYVRLDVRDFAAIVSRGQAEWLAARYLAFVLLADAPDSIAVFDLGEAERLERYIEGARVSLARSPVKTQTHSDASGTDAEDQVRRIVFDPFASVLSGRRRILMSPDADLATLPFEALPLNGGTRLIDRYQFSYLSSGRDLLRRQSTAGRRTGAALVAADPDFDIASSSGSSLSTNDRQSRDLDRSQGAHRLPGTRLEGKAVASMLGVSALLGGDVTKQQILDLRSPSIVHLATHGFFLKSQIGFRATLGFAPPRLENPMLRSGLLLAGFNTWLAHGPSAAGAGDGMLNGEDVAGLDLTHTDLVVLSACETGLGEIRAGEGVFGLRRAFVVAGARNLVMSLWKVPDKQTQELMVDFYQRVLAGQPLAEGLRQAQLAIKAKWPNPVFWAAFICQGDAGLL